MMNSPPGFTPPVPSRHVHHPIASIVVPPRMHPRQMLRTNQPGLHPVPPSAHPHSYRRTRPCTDPNIRPSFRPPMMPFMPYPIPMGMYVPPQAFGCAMPVSATPLHRHTQQVHHVHHHHYYHSDEDFDTNPYTSERAFPSREARQRHGQFDAAPQVFDPDGDPIAAGHDDGPEVVDIEQAGWPPGTEIVLRNTRRHQSALYLAARAAEQEYGEERQAGVEEDDGEQRANIPVRHGSHKRSITTIEDERTDTTEEGEITTAQVDLAKNSSTPPAQYVSNTELKATSSLDELQANAVIPTATEARPEASHATSPRMTRSFVERQFSPRPSLSEGGQERAMSMQ